MASRASLGSTVLAVVTAVLLARSRPAPAVRPDAEGAASQGTLPPTVVVPKPAAASDSGQRRGPVTGSDLVDEYNAAGRWPAPHACPWKVGVRRTLVVILPDPLDSHSDWQFDAGIESVRRALEQAGNGGYVIDRYWLPWKQSASTSGASAVDSAAPMRSRAPGVMLFRSRGVPDALVLVYVVGETPTRGIQTAAFRAALADRDVVLDCARYDAATGAARRRLVDSLLGLDSVGRMSPDSTRKRLAAATAAALRRDLGRADSAEHERDTTRLRVVGPIFSGSARSLRYALEDWRGVHHGAQVCVVSGGATAPTTARELRSDTTAMRPLVDGACADTGISYYATVNSLDALQRTIERAFERELHIKRREIAYLAESGTQFGAAAAGGARAAAAAAGGRESTTRTQAADSVPPLVIPFPLNISRLRKEYRRQVLPTDTIGQSPSRTRFDWKDPAAASETPEPLSDLTAPMIERTIADIEQTLLLHRIRAVGIVATDVRDRLFLASVVKERFRDVKVFLLVSHALYLRPEVNRDLRGTLVVSTYPLFLENQFWDLTHGDRTRLVFTSDPSEGTYNATLAQLGDAARMVDYTYPMQGVDDDSGGGGGSGGRRATHDSVFAAPVWITVVGAASLLPVQARPDSASARSRGAQPYLLPRYSLAVGASTEKPPRWYDGLVLAVALALAFGLALATHRWGSPAQRWPKRTPPAPAATADALPARAGSPAPRRVPAPQNTEEEARAARLRALARGRLCAERVKLLRHGQSWMFFRSVAILGAFAPLALVLFEPLVHGSAVTRPVPALLAALMAAGWLAVTLDGLLDTAAARRAAAGERQPPSHDWRDRLRRLGRHAPHVAIWLAAAFYFLATAAFVIRVVTLDRPRAAPFFLRALALSSGVTPVVPLVVGAAVLWSWCTWHLRRVTSLGFMSAFEAACMAECIDASGLGPTAVASDAHRAVPAGPGVEPSALGRARTLHDAVWSVRHALIALLPRSSARVMLVALGLLGAWVLAQFDRSIEAIALGTLLPLEHWASSFDLLLRFLIFAAVGLSVWALYRFLVVWWGLRLCLRNVEAMPLGSSFGRLPRSIAALTRLTPFNSPPDSVVDLAIDRAVYARWLELRERGDDADASLRALLSAPDAQPCPKLRSTRGEFDPSVARPLVVMHEVLRRKTRQNYRIFADVLDADPDDREAEKRKAKSAAAPGPRDEVTVTQEIVALYVVDYVEWVVRHLRQTAFSLIGSLVLTTVLLSSYPFEPESLIKTFFFGLMATSVVAIATVLFQMNRDPTMSRIAHTTPGEVNWDVRLVINLLLIVGVPLLTLVGAEFPQVRELLFSWVTPAVKSVGKG